MTFRRSVEALISRIRSPKGVKSGLFFWTVLVLVLAGTFVVSSLPLGLYTPTVGFQQSRHRKLPRVPEAVPVKSPAGSAVINGFGQRIVAVADLHGDLQRLRNVLRAAEVLDEETDSWREGCNDILVQLGDVVDRGPYAPEILHLLQRLKEESVKQGGRVVTLSGNHELSALMGNIEDVHPRLLEESGGPLGFRHLFGPGGRYGRIFVEDSYAVALIGDVVFVHGGLTAKFAARSIDYINNQLWYKAATSTNLSEHVFHASDSPLWDRSLVASAMNHKCEPLDAALTAVQAVQGVDVRAMVVGHTMMENGKVGVWCDGRLVTADVGMSTYIEGGGYEAYVTVAPLIVHGRKRNEAAPSRIGIHYPLGVGVRVNSNETTTVDNEPPM